jgi:polyphenol oxidase
MRAPALADPVTERAVAQTPVPRFELDAWRAWGLRAGITGREGGFDLGLFAGGPAAAVMDHWLSFEASQRPAFSALAVSRQVHGTRILRHVEAGEGWRIGDGFDGHLTGSRGLLLTITVADCVPVYLAHRDSGTIALLHAGWRGVASGMLEAGLDHLITHSRSSAPDIVMHCGVGICGACYEVGSEVTKAVTGRITSSPTQLDLRAELAMRAADLGVRNITVSTWCSSHDSRLFFSHRRSGGDDGRMVAYLGVPGDKK